MVLGSADQRKSVMNYAAPELCDIIMQDEIAVCAMDYAILRRLVRLYFPFLVKTSVFDMC
jgi:hypothetical protein